MIQEKGQNLMILEELLKPIDVHLASFKFALQS